MKFDEVEYLSNKYICKISLLLKHMKRLLFLFLFGSPCSNKFKRTRVFFALESANGIKYALGLFYTRVLNGSANCMTNYYGIEKINVNMKKWLNYPLVYVIHSNQNLCPTN